MLADDPDALPDGYVPLGRLHALAGTPAPSGREFAPSTETLSGVLIALAPLEFVLLVPLLWFGTIAGVPWEAGIVGAGVVFLATNVGLAVADLRTLDARDRSVRVTAVLALVPIVYLVVRARAFASTDWTPRRLLSVHVVACAAVLFAWQVAERLVLPMWAINQVYFTSLTG